VDNLNIVGGNGTGLYVKGDNATLNDVKITNHEGTSAVIDGEGTKGSTIPATSADKAFTIPTTASTNPVFTINNLPSDANGNFSVAINGKVVKTVPVVNGTADPITLDLAPGNYSVLLEYGDDPKYLIPITKSGLMEVKEPVIRIIDNKDLTVSYSGIATYSVRVLADGVNITDGTEVTFVFNGAKLTAKTVKGIATVTLNSAIKVGKYTITASYKDKNVTNNVEILNIIKSSLKKLKKSKKVNKVKVTLAKVDGKYLSKKTVVLKLKGKKVASAKTNSKGVATLKVKKKSLKKFKKGKKVVANFVYGQDILTKKIKIA